MFSPSLFYIIQRRPNLMSSTTGFQAAFGGGYTTASHNFIPSISTQNVPQHQSRVFIEQNTGLFVPLDVHMQIESKQQMEILQRAMGTTAWNFHEDAKDYQQHLQAMMKFLRRCLDMTGGLACGFSAFKLLDVYSSAESRSDSVFLQSYSGSANVIPKCYLFLSLMLVVLSLLPMAFDLAMESLEAVSVGTQFSASAQRAAVQGGSSPSGVATSASVAMGSRSLAAQNVSSSGVGGRSATMENNAAGGSSRRPFAFARKLATNTYQRLFRFLGIGSPNDSPYRHMLQLRFFAYVAALAVTIFEIAVVDQRRSDDSSSILLLSSGDIGRLHGAILSRAGLFAIGWLFSLTE